MKRIAYIVTVISLVLAVSGCSSAVEESTEGVVEVVNKSEDTDMLEVKAAIEAQESLGWELVFSDEFNGDSLDSSIWKHQEGTGSQFGLEDWGNGEAQYYQEENVSVQDGQLQIEARLETVEGKSYTSGRITTKDNYAKAYGRFEAMISCPIGDGFWPAFWMLPQEEVYGTWAASGEIDILEVRGRFKRNVNSALHYGGVWPNNVYIGSTFKLEDSVEIFHEYAIEWEPGEIRWYVDGELYYTANDWYSVTEGSLDNNAYPAPFDQPFYMLLNLAMGGTYDEYRLPEDSELPAVMKVDYVRVYELVGREYMEAVAPVEIVGELSEKAKKPVEGNYIYDVPYNEEITSITDGSIALDETLWNVVALSDFAGVVEHEIVSYDDGNSLLLAIKEQGNESYSVQLIQHIPLGENRTYELTFDAKSTESRDIKLKVGSGASRGWKMYAPDTTVSLNSEFETYTLTFKMIEATDELARLEFNCGLSDLNVEIRNISLVDLTAIKLDSNIAE